MSSLLFVARWHGLVENLTDRPTAQSGLVIQGGLVLGPATYALTGLALAGLLASRLARRRASATSA
ncbi:MAG: hypothetical protein IPM99_01635 [Rubrivivax sp.]|nr:hypothetical protein [Rubrivivax sp.]